LASPSSASTDPRRVRVSRGGVATLNLLIQEESLEISNFRNITNQPYQCRACCKLFDRKARLQDHLNQWTSHRKSTGYFCYFCCISFNCEEKEEYMRHLLNHVGKDSPFLCIHCRMEFGNMTAFVRHRTGTCHQFEETENLASHGVNSSSQTDVVDSFLEQLDDNQKDRLQSFLTLLKTHQCGCCLRSYSRTNELKNHHNLFPEHIGSMVYQCHFCEEPFPKKERMEYLRHLLPHFGEEKPYFCRGCKVFCSSMNQLSKHRRSDECKLNRGKLIVSADSCVGMQSNPSSKENGNVECVCKTTFPSRLDLLIHVTKCDGRSKI
jgi:hypothetical protein